MNTRSILTVLVGLASSTLIIFAAQAGSAEDEARMIRVMEQMDASSAKLASMESTMLSRQEEIGQAVGLILASEAGMPFKWIVRNMGLTPEEVDQLEEWKELEVEEQREQDKADLEMQAEAAPDPPPDASSE